MLRGEVDNLGWADPSLQHVGSASVNLRSDTLQRVPFEILRMHRELSLITLDSPNWDKSERVKTFYDQVILPLVDRRAEFPDLYAWLDAMFRFCPRKTVAYFSRYVPSVRVHRVAAKHGVRVLHYPLTRIPKPLLDRNRQFRFMQVTKRQWEEISKRLAEKRGAWGVSVGGATASPASSSTS